MMSDKLAQLPSQSAPAATARLMAMVKIANALNDCVLSLDTHGVIANAALCIRHSDEIKKISERGIQPSGNYDSKTTDAYLLTMAHEHATTKAKLNDNESANIVVALMVASLIGSMAAEVKTIYERATIDDRNTRYTEMMPTSGVH